MSWNNIDTQYKIKYGNNLVSCTAPFERKFIIQTIAEEFPQFSRVRIAAAVDHCFRIYEGSIERRTFVTFIQLRLR